MNVVNGYLLMTNVSPRVWQSPIWSHPQVIGRLPECEITIPPAHLHVSRRHAMIGSRHNTMWLQDLGSSGGTQVNGVPLLPDSETCVVIGDRVSLAGLELYLVSPQAEIIREFLREETANRARDSQLSGTTGLGLGNGRAANTFQTFNIQCLSPAELEVVRWICRGSTTIKEIGQNLFRSPHTVRTQLNSIYKKLNVHSREELLAYMRQSENAWTKSPETDHDMQSIPQPAGVRGRIN